MISTSNELTAGNDLSTGSVNHTHALLTTDGESNYSTGDNQTFVAAFTTDSDSNPINKVSTLVSGFELLLRNDIDNSVSQVSFDSEGILQGQKDLTAEEIINFEMLMINDIDGDGIDGFRFVSELLSPNELSTNNTYRMRLSETTAGLALSSAAMNPTHGAGQTGSDVTRSSWVATSARCFFIAEKGIGRQGGS